jgi:hypothetical protein
MPNEVQSEFNKLCNGRVVEYLSMAGCQKHAYVSHGFCSSMCVQYMCGIQTANLPTKNQLLEDGQWMYEADAAKRSEEYAQQHGIKRDGECRGSWLYDELYAGNFLSKSDRRYYWIVGVRNTTRDTDHAFLMYNTGSIMDGNNWFLLDPNGGIAGFELAGSCLLAFKRVLKGIYSGQCGPDSNYGPYYPFVIGQFTPS